jgi:hypothetical protein
VRGLDIENVKVLTQRRGVDDQEGATDHLSVRLASAWLAL